nr:DNA polymerase III subunit delta [uncultured Porphyromonas sp.]
MPTYDELTKAIKSKSLAPAYLLAGEEPLYIDRLAQLLLDTLIPEEERDFNLSVLYGAEVGARDILTEAMRFPMMGARVLVVVREAQLIKDLDLLAEHLEALPSSTCLVLCYKKKPDKRKALYKRLEAAGAVYESSRIYDSKLPDFITKSFAEHQLAIDPRAASLMAEATGNDLEKILGEVEKIALALSARQQRQVGLDEIEQYIGVSKEYNGFELQSALIKRDAARAYRIAFYFAANERNHPIQQILAMLFGFFSNLMAVHYMGARDERSIAAGLKISPYAARDYNLARTNYNAAQVFAIIRQLRLLDAYSKGVDASIPSSELYKELVTRILDT